MSKIYEDSVMNYLIKKNGYNNPFSIEVDRIASATKLSSDVVDRTLDALINKQLISIEKNGFVIKNNKSNIDTINILNLGGRIKDHISVDKILCKINCPTISSVQNKLNGKIKEYNNELACTGNLKQLLKDILPIFQELDEYHPINDFEKKRKRILMSKCNEILFIMTKNKKVSLKNIL